jgi:HD-GYP domain-containing protein (c-di-GMP phosphodiesterase class II)
MLSDRPYRDALSVAMVRSELRDFSGKHFDPRLVDAVLRSSILTEHAAVIQLAPIRSVYAESPAITQTRFGSQSPM